MYNENCFRVLPLILAPLFLAGNAALAAGIPVEVVINQPGMVYMAAGKGHDSGVSLQVSGKWSRSAGYQFGYVAGSIFSPIINGDGAKHNLSFQDGTSVDFAVRNKGDDGMFGTTDDTLFRLADAAGYAVQMYSDPNHQGSTSGSPVDYSKLTLRWDINSDDANDLSVLLKSTTCDTGMHFAPATPVPVPAALWLLGSGIVGLTTFLRRRKTV